MSKPTVLYSILCHGLSRGYTQISLFIGSMGAGRIPGSVDACKNDELNFVRQDSLIAELWVIHEFLVGVPLTAKRR